MDQPTQELHLGTLARFVRRHSVAAGASRLATMMRAPAEEVPGKHRRIRTETAAQWN